MLVIVRLQHLKAHVDSSESHPTSRLYDYLNTELVVYTGTLELHVETYLNVIIDHDDGNSFRWDGLGGD